MRAGDEISIQQNTYQMGELLHQSSYGKVFRGLNKKTQQIIAIKIQDSINEDEIKVLDIMTRKTHKNLVNILNFERIGRKYYIVMEQCKENLFDRIARQGTIQPDEVRYIMKQIGNGIQEIHGLGYAHRDIKTENILIFQVNDNGKTQDVYKICDFNTIKSLDDLKTNQVGTVQYLAPEQVNGQDNQYSQKVDIWAFGVLIYELLTGNLLFNGNNEYEVFSKIKSMTQADIDNKINQHLRIERKYRTLLLNMLQIDIKKRYSIQDVVSALRGQSQTRSIKEFQGIQPKLNFEELLPRPSKIQEYQKQLQMKPCEQPKPNQHEEKFRASFQCQNANFISPNHFSRQNQIINRKQGVSPQPQKQQEQKYIEYQQGGIIKNQTIGQYFPKQQPQNIQYMPKPCNNIINQNAFQYQQNVISNKQPQNGNYFASNNMMNNLQQLYSNQNNQNKKQGDNDKQGQGNASKVQQFIGAQSTFGNQNLQSPKQYGNVYFSQVRQEGIKLNIQWK